MNEGTSEVGMTYGEQLRMVWLLWWRGLLVNGGLGFIWGFILGFAYERSPAVNAAIFIGAILLGFFVGGPIVIRMLMRKHFKGFHLEIARHRTVESATAP